MEDKLICNKMLSNNKCINNKEWSWCSKLECNNKTNLLDNNKCNKEEWILNSPNKTNGSNFNNKDKISFKNSNNLFLVAVVKVNNKNLLSNKPLIYNNLKDNLKYSILEIWTEFIHNLNKYKQFNSQQILCNPNNFNKS